MLYLQISQIGMFAFSLTHFSAQITQEAHGNATMNHRLSARVSFVGLTAQRSLLLYSVSTITQFNSAPFALTATLRYLLHNVFT